MCGVRISGTRDLPGFQKRADSKEDEQEGEPAPREENHRASARLSTARELPPSGESDENSEDKKEKSDHLVPENTERFDDRGNDVFEELFACSNHS